MEGRSRLTVGGCAWIAGLRLTLGLCAAVLAAEVGIVRAEDPPSYNPVRCDLPGCDPARCDPARCDLARYNPVRCDPPGRDPARCDPAGYNPVRCDLPGADPAGCPREINPGGTMIFSDRPLTEALPTFWPTGLSHDRLGSGAVSAATQRVPGGQDARAPGSGIDATSEGQIGPVVPAAAWLSVQQPAVAPAASPEPVPVPRPQPNGAPGPYAGGNNSQEKLGTAPADNRMEFLRRATVLLQPGQAQFDWGIDYTWQDTVSPALLTDLQLAHERLRDRRLVAPLALRYGLTKRLQAFVNMPAGFGFLERANPEHDEFDTVFNLGDISAGVNHLLRKGRGSCPDLIGTLAFTAPTGPNPYRHPGEDAILGTGFWNISYDLLFVKALDPAVILYGVGYRHYFARDFLGGVLAPGEELNYNFGVGFAVTDRLTLSTIFLGTYRPDLRFNGTGLKGTSEEPMSLRLALTAVATNCCILEPFVRFGITPDAPQAHLGIIVTRTF